MLAVPRSPCQYQHLILLSTVQTYTKNSPCPKDAANFSKTTDEIDRQAQGNNETIHVGMLSSDVSIPLPLLLARFCKHRSKREI